MSNSVFMPAVLLRAFDFRSPQQKRMKTDARRTISDENEGEWMQFLKL